jgi:hypothetical protein
MTLLKNILTTFLVLTSIIVFGQKTEVDSVALDLKKLNDVDFFKKYSTYEKTISKDDFEATKLIWSTKHLRAVDKSLKDKGIKTLTIIDGRPSNVNKYYTIGHYQLATPDHLARMSFYRVDLKNKTIEYQDLDDFREDKWKKVFVN